jgi:hypothetical protein
MSEHPDDRTPASKPKPGPGDATPPDRLPDDTARRPPSEPTEALEDAPGRPKGPPDAAA